MESIRFSTPIGETLLEEAAAKLYFSREMTALFAGGPTQLTEGRLYLTDRRLAFRPRVDYPHPQTLDLKLAQVRDVREASRRWLGLFPVGTELRLQAELYGRGLDIAVRVEDCPAWAARIDAARQSLQPEQPPSDLLDAALELELAAQADPAHSLDRASFVDTLAALSFPQGFWHPEALDELGPLLEDVFEQLGVASELSPDLMPRLMAELESALQGEPTSYEEEDEDAERRDQIEICMRAVNQDLERAAEPAQKRFYCFLEDLPNWDADEPIWLYLSAEQAERLVETGVLTPRL